MIRCIGLIVCVGLITAAAGAQVSEDPCDPYAPPRVWRGGADDSSGRRPSSALIPTDALTPANPILGGRLETVLDGTAMLLPALNTDVHVNIVGDVATVTVLQTFENPTGEPLDATFVFPLTQQEAVYSIALVVGEEVVMANTEVFAGASHSVETAGSTSSRWRPNRMTRQIADWSAEQPLTVQVRYEHRVPLVDGRYQLRVPLIVAPGVAAPEESAPPPSSAAAAPNVFWQLVGTGTHASTLDIELPTEADAEGVSISVDLNADEPIAALASPTHPVVVEEDGPNARHIETIAAEAIDSRDFVLTYSLATPGIPGSVLVQRDDSVAPRGAAIVDPPAAAAVLLPGGVALAAARRRREARGSR